MILQMPVKQLPYEVLLGGTNVTSVNKVSLNKKNHAAIREALMAIDNIPPYQGRIPKKGHARRRTIRSIEAQFGMSIHRMRECIQGADKDGI